MSDQLRICTFGGISLTVNDSAVTPFASPKAAALLVYLAANPRPHLRDTLATLLWDAGTPARARGNLSEVLSSLRKPLGDFVEISDQTVGIHPDANVWLDSAEFAKQISAVGDPTIGNMLSASQVRQLEAALAWYQGSFLEGFSLRDAPGFEKWAAQERDRLRQLARSAKRLIATERPAFECPAETTLFLGREAELNQIAQHIADPTCRLLTITGVGGIGKSRLALHAAHRFANQFSHGVAFVSLAAIDTPALMPYAIGDALKLRYSGVGDPITELCDYLRQKEVLLVLDNVDHLHEGGLLLQQLLDAAPNLMVLATSRKRLQLEPEWLLPLSGLAYATTNALDDEPSPAVALFAQSARRVRADFELTGQISAVAQICQMVDGIPLGIELAASWVRVLSCDDIVQRLTQSRNGHRQPDSLQMVFEQSWTLLTSAEKTALCHLALFRGDFSRTAAEQVTGLSLLTLTALADKSLVRLHTPQRYQMHPLLRTFCLAKLAKDEAAMASAERNHATHYIQFLASCQAGLIGGKQQAMLAKIRVETGNIQGVWTWLWAHWEEPDVQALPLWEAIEALFYFSVLQSHFQEGVDWFKQAMVSLRTSAETELYPRVLARMGWLMYLHGEPEAGEQYLITAETLFEDANDAQGCQFCTTFLGVIAFYRGDLDVALELVSQALTIARAIRYSQGETIALNVLGMIHYKLGLFDEAETLLRECLRLKKQLGDRFGMSFSLGFLGNVAVAQQDYTTAHRIFRQSLELRRELGDRRGEALCLADLAELEMRQQQFEAAQTHWLQAATIWQDLGNDSAERATRNRAEQVASRAV